MTPFTARLRRHLLTVRTVRKVGTERRGRESKGKIRRDRDELLQLGRIGFLEPLDPLSEVLGHQARRLFAC